MLSDSWLLLNFPYFKVVPRTLPFSVLNSVLHFRCFFAALHNTLGFAFLWTIEVLYLANFTALQLILLIDP